MTGADGSARRLDVQPAAPTVSAATFDLVEALGDAGVELEAASGRLSFKAPAGRLTAELKDRMREHKAELLALLAPAPSEAATVPELPLTELQQSYWLGEAGVRGVAGAGYWYERFFARELDVLRLQDALDRLVARHEALRTVFTADGRGAVLPEVGRYPLRQEDLTGLSPEATAHAVERLASELRLPSTKPDTWPLYHMAVQRTSEGCLVHVAGRLLIADAPSTQTLGSELKLLYEDPARTDLPEPGNTTDAVLRRFRRRVSKRYQDDLRYWAERELPPGATLPLRARADERDTRIERLVGGLSEAETDALVEQARRMGVTADNALLAAFALVLRRWGQSSRFCINVLHATDAHLAPYPLRQSGSVVRLAVAPERHVPFRELCAQVQQQLAMDLSHAWVDGVTVQRMSMRRGTQGMERGVVAYSSGLGIGKQGSAFGLRQLGWESEEWHLQSPGVLVDCQVLMHQGCIRFHWDVDTGMLAPGVAEAMMASYQELVRRVVAAGDWSVPYAAELPAEQAAARARANATATPRTLHHLHTLVDEQAAKRQGPAVIAPARSLSFAELGAVADALCARVLRDREAHATVAIVAAKGWEQVAAALGIVRAGSAYVAIDAGWPSERIAQILAKAECRLALCDARGLTALEACAGVQGVAIVSIEDEARRPPEPLDAPRVSPEAPAYIMFTSGSTGEPKGVVISHDAVATTIEDILRRFEIGPGDCVLGVSNMYFDLSVFDVFGVLGAGGRLVLPGPGGRPDPGELIALIQAHGVTLWNTVPMIMEMVAERAEQMGIQLPTLRVIMLSGDWIPIELPARLRKVCPRARIISLGGATEASIWSNWFEVQEVLPDWTSIPYGYPLANQRLLVLDTDDRECPDWLDGDLAIAGDGLAMGYWRAPELTAERFVTRPSDGQRMYRTGDRARRWPDGNIEFLGRVDGQVKIGGYRVELGEIVARLARCPGVDRAAVVAVGAREHRSLVGFVSPERFDAELVRGVLEKQLPAYMVPRRLVGLREIPLTANGKVDQARLVALATSTGSQADVPRSEQERVMAEVWAEVLGRRVDDRRLSFFEAGGQSLLAVRLQNAIERRCGARVSFADLLRVPTVEGMATLLDASVVAPAQSPIFRLQQGTRPGQNLVCIHPVGGTVFCYQQLVAHLGPEPAVIGLQSLGVARDVTEVTRLAELYVAHLREAKTTPTVLFGWSMGGVIALEVQRRFEELGVRCPAVLVDPWVRAEGWTDLDPRSLQRMFIRDVLQGGAGLGFGELDELLDKHPLSTVVDLLADRQGSPRIGDEAMVLFEDFRRNSLALLRHTPPSGPIDAEVWVATEQATVQGRSAFPHLRPLEDVCTLRDRRVAAADHYRIMEGEHLARIAASIRARLDAGQGGGA